jgi:hypothetical protein
VSSVEHPLEGLLAAQPLGVLATESEHEPYASLLAFAAEGIWELFMATPRSSRKWGKVAANANVSFLVDDRLNVTADFTEAVAATAMGVALECTDEEAVSGRELLCGRHPHLRDFLEAPSTSLLRVHVSRWYVVERFQNVTLVEPGE